MGTILRAVVVSHVAATQCTVGPVTCRLLNAYLAGTIDEATYSAKSAELKGETAKAEETIEQLATASSR